MKNILYLFVATLAWPVQISAQESYWPVTRERNGAQLTTYQPQVEAWADYAEITFRQAFAFTPKKGEAEQLGVVRARALTDVDMASHSVLVHDIEVLYVHFPSLDSAAAAGLKPAVTAFIPDSLGLTVEQVAACVPKETTAKPAAVSHDPPDIFVSFAPALLLKVEKTAMSSDIPETSLSYVFNASWPVFFDKKGNAYYLWDEQEWLTSGKLDGTWQITTKLPAEMNNLAKDTLWASFKEALPPPKPMEKNKKAPRVFFSSKPAELVLFDGEPKWQKIPDNTLVYAKNASHDVFKDSKTGKYYILVGGRWYRTADLDANKWSYATDDLPADFSRIPYSNPAARVLASVPGTEAAKDAVLIAQIPTRIVVDPEAAAKEVNVTYDGEPRFEPIEGTSLTYAVNTADKVVGMDGTYYVCYQGIWFLSSSPTGPWTTAKTIPAEIYDIPASSPVYNVTFVTQAETEDGNVEASYTSGYTGSYVSGAGASVVVVFGTGYYYPPYYYHPPYGYPYCYHYPPAYGYPYYGYGNTYYRASYNPYTGTYGRSATTYGPYGSATVGQAYNPYTGTSARGVSTTTPYGRNSYAEAYNPYTRTYAQTEQHSNYNGQWGSSTISNSQGTVQTGHAVSDQGAIAGARSTSGAAAIRATGESGTGGAVRTKSGDVYAGSDGNVYKKTDSGWQQVGGAQPGTTQARTTQAQPSAGQQPAAPSAKTSAAPRTTSSSVSSAQAQELNRQAADRSRGNYSSSQYSAARSSSSYSRPSTSTRTSSMSRPSGGGMRRR